jgi:hypothetical protein
MGKFLVHEKEKQAMFKATSPYFSEDARQDGVYRKKLRPYCLPVDHAEENLFKEIRNLAVDYFRQEKIKWHDGRNGKPSNHLCSSQVCCVNFLLPFAQKPLELATLLRPIFPNIRKMLPIECGLQVSFEWIGEENYLQEKTGIKGNRTRGANFTSADAAVMFERTDGKRQFVLIEWKYTESYGGGFLKVAKSGTDRTKIYYRLYDRNDCPINKDLLPGFDDLFFEPFYQLMRQQFLAHEMERMREHDADVVSVLHIAPNHNSDFHKITSPKLQHLGKTPIEVWKKIVRSPDRFISVSTEELLGNLSIGQLPQMQSWFEYIAKRYTWIQENHL